MSAKDFLFEMGCDELPANTLIPISQALKENFATLLHEAQLKFHSIHCYASPRRFAIYIHQLTSEQPAQTIERTGPSIETAFDKDGTPTLACIGFARSCGISTDQLQIKSTEKGQRVYCRIEQAGEKTETILSELIHKAVNKLPLKKPMRWGYQEKPFIRPVQWLVALYGEQVLPLEMFGLKAQAITYGHRFHYPSEIKITHPKDYEGLLLDPGKVMVDFEKRKQNIRAQIEKKSAQYGLVRIDEKLLNEVTGLVEWPVVQIGEFKHEFLDIPPEALITSMKVHQKCFPIVIQNRLQPHFVMVSNIESKDPKTVIRGNERVINARLADAAFFYDNDLNKPIQYFVDRLQTVIFQKQLGTLFDRSRRLSVLTQFIAKELKLDIELAKRAGQLAKFDLMSEMVGEFPELQGVMGYYYTKHQGESELISLAIKEHYYPRFSGDQLPHEKLSAALAIADRIDLIVGILGVNLIPSGEKDPYALKRAAHGIVRILIEKALPLDLLDLINHACQAYGYLPNANIVNQALEFIGERMRSWYLEQGVRTEIFSAVAACSSTKPADFDLRLKAVQQFQNLPESSSLAAANKRVNNILKKSLEHPIKINIDKNLFTSDVERQLADLLEQKNKQVSQLYQNAQYTEALTALATLKDPVDNFFDQVMILVEDKKIRANRLALLNELRHLFTQVADISQLP